MFDSKLKKKVFFDSTSERVISKTIIARTTKLLVTIGFTIDTQIIYIFKVGHASFRTCKLIKAEFQT